MLFRAVLSFNRPCNDNHWFVLSRRFVYRFNDLVEVMPVDISGCPVITLPFWRKRFNIENIFCSPESLEFVVVDDESKVVQFVMSGEERCLPCRAFITFSV